MDDWLRNLPGELAYAVIGALLWHSARRAGRTAWQKRKRLIGRAKSLRVTVADRVGISDATTQTLRGGGIKGHADSVGGGALVGTAQGRSSAYGVLSVSFPKKLSAAEELFWWYWRIWLS